MMVEMRKNVITLAKIIGKSLIKIPYVSHITTPISDKTNIPSERSRVFFVLIVLMACGKNATVVSEAPIIPIIVTEVNSIKNKYCP